MKTSFRDSLLIGAALFTILGCGFGLGRLSQATVSPAPRVEAQSLRHETLTALKESLQLTPEQELEIIPSLDSFTEDVLRRRHETLKEYYDSLLEFQNEIAPKLSPRQQEILKANQKLLKIERERRFSIPL